MATNPLISSEVSTLRAKAARGVFLTLEEVRTFVAAVRKSYTAAKEAIPEGKKSASRVKKPDQPIDFF